SRTMPPRGSAYRSSRAAPGRGGPKTRMTTPAAPRSRSHLQLYVDSLVHLELERSVWAHVPIDQRRQCPEITLGHPLPPLRFVEHSLKHQRVYVNEARLEQVQCEDGDLLVFESVGGDLAPLAEEDEAVGAVPVLDDVQPFVDLAAKCFDVEVAAEKQRL